MPENEDPAARVSAVFERIHRTRMHDVPILNPRLRVEAVGFRVCAHGWIGALITPWFINLMLLPARDRSWQALPWGVARAVRFPAGEFEFIGGEEPALGEYHACSLFSPVLEFEDQTAARATALAAIQVLFDPQLGETKLTDATDEPAAPAPVSRRDFLRGALGGSRPA